MKRFVWAGALTVIFGFWGGAGWATAQTPGPPRVGTAPPPAGYSPYLNLIRTGNRGAAYYGLVRPQQYFQGAIQGLQAQDQLLAASAAGGQAEGADLPSTGVPVGFMNHHMYFMNLGATGLGSGMVPGRTNATQLGTGAQGPARPAPRTR